MKKAAVPILVFIISCFAVSAKNNISLQKEVYDYNEGRYRYETREIRLPDRYLPGAVYVKFSRGVSGNLKSLLAGVLGQSYRSAGIALDPLLPGKQGPVFQTEDRNGLARIHKLYFSEELSVFEVCKVLTEKAYIEYAAPVATHKLRNSPNDPYYQDQWNLKSIDFDCSRELADGGSSDITIAIVDTGVELDHDDLQNCFWVNEDEIPNDGIDNDQNGFVDDIHGWDFAGDVSYDDVLQGNLKPDGNPNTDVSRNWHGTAVAGAAVASTDDSIGIAAPAYRCKIMPVKCMTDRFGYPVGYDDIIKGYEGILYAAQNGADIINVSWGGNFYNPVEHDIFRTVTEEYGCLVVTAATNYPDDYDEYVDYPNDYGFTITVSGYNSEDDYRSYAYGSDICVWAPATGILTTLPGNQHQHKSGTSFAAPQVSAAAALLKSVYPEYSNHTIYHVLRASSVPFDSDTSNVARSKHFGKLNLCNALKLNRPDLGGVSSPGIALEKIEYPGGDALSIPGENKVMLHFKNYLGTAENIRISLNSTRHFLQTDRDEFLISQLDSGESTALTAVFDLTPANPWFRGSAELGISYESDNYFNIEQIALPVDIPSGASRQTLIGAEKSFPTDWRSFSAGDSNMVWLGGYIPDFNMGLVVALFDESRVLFSTQFQNAAITASEAIGKIGYFGTSDVGSGKAEVIYYNFDNRQHQTRVPVGHVLDMVYGIKFYSPENGIIVGMSYRDTLSYGITADSGNSWTRKPIRNIDFSNAGEIRSKAVYIDDNRIFLGTSTGAIICSDDRGETWDMVMTPGGSTIEMICFADSLRGIALYSEDDWRKIKVMRTDDGGKDWQKTGFDFADIDALPVSMNRVDDEIYIVASKSEIFKYDFESDTPEVIKSMESNDISASKIIKTDGELFVYRAGNAVELLKLPVLYSGNAKLTIFPDTLDFGDIPAGESVVRSITATHNIEGLIGVERVSVDGEDETFSVRGPVGNFIATESGLSINIEALSDISGEKIAVLTVETAADTAQAVLKANFYDASSVGDIPESKLVRISPNPAKDNFIIEVDKSLLPAAIKIHDISGKCVFSKENFNYSKVFINFVNPEKGVYLINIFSGEKVVRKKVMIE